MNIPRNSLLGIMILLTVSLSQYSMAAALKTGTTAPDFTLKSLQGKQIALKDLQKKGITMLIFWEPECMYCYMHIQEFNTLHKKYNNKGLTIAAINFLGEHDAEIQEYVDNNNLKYMMLSDRLKNIDVASAYKVFASPTIVVISKQGKILYYGHKVPDIRQWLP